MSKTDCSGHKQAVLRVTMIEEASARERNLHCTEVARTDDLGVDEWIALALGLRLAFDGDRQFVRALAHILTGKGKRIVEGRGSDAGDLLDFLDHATIKPLSFAQRLA
jgi:hypothetical protein